MGSKIISTGTYTPQAKLHNDDLTAYFDTSHEWIYQRTGIASRHISNGEETSDFAANAAKQAIERAGISAEQIGFIIVATMSSDYISPSTACIVQEKIRATQAFAFDINAACSGFVYALTVGEKLMASGQYNYGLIIGAETMSKLLDWSDRSSAVLFGDGAGCVLLEKSDTKLIQFAQLGSDGAKYHCLTAHSIPVVNPLYRQETNTSVTNCLRMDGREIFNFATRKVPQLISDILAQTNLSAEAIDYYCCHQANARMIEIIAKKIDVDNSKFPINISEYGNTSAASLPILMDELINNGKITLTQTQKVMLLGFGGGLTWGGLLLNI